MKIAAVLIPLLLVACGSPEPEPKAQPPEGRAETRNIRNTEAIGYSGGAIADKVDGALDQNDERKKKLDESLEASE